MPIRPSAEVRRGEERRGEERGGLVCSHDAGLNVLTHALVVVVVVGPTGRGVEGRNAVEIEDKILSVAHWSGVMLVTGQAH